MSNIDYRKATDRKEAGIRYAVLVEPPQPVPVPRYIGEAKLIGNLVVVGRQERRCIFDIVVGRIVKVEIGWNIGQGSAVAERKIKFPADHFVVVSLALGARARIVPRIAGIERILIPHSSMVVVTLADQIRRRAMFFGKTAP